jgi:2-hydroxy-3-oxopropionate reductase
MTTVGFFGLGRMGGPMAGHLAAAGHEVLGFDPSPEARAAAAGSGIDVLDEPEGIDCAVVLSSLPDGPEVEALYLGGLFDILAPGALCLDMSTIDVEVSRGIARAASASGHRFLDCPVSGTSLHARAGTLAVMVGGDPEAAESARPYLDTFASSVHHLGPNGAGLEMKLITNRLLNAHLVAVAEAILEMEDAGLDVGDCIELLRVGAVPRLLDYKALPMSNRDHTPLFTVDLMAKDLRLAATRRQGGAVGAVAAALLFDAQQRGWGASDISAVIEVLSTRR